MTQPLAQVPRRIAEEKTLNQDEMKKPDPQLKKQLKKCAPTWTYERTVQVL